MQNIYSLRDSNIRGTFLLFFVFLLVVIGAGFFFAYIWQSWIILYVAIAYSLINSIIAYYNSDKIALTISGAKKASKDEYRELYNIVENLCISQGLPTPKVYIIQDNSPNAFATGRDTKHSSVALTTGLLSMMDRTELEGVLAHEISHIKNYDILFASVVVVLMGTLSILSEFFLRSFGFRGRDNERGSGGILVIVGIIFAILIPIVGILIRLAISRNREFFADSTAALITRYPEGLASALEKIGRSPKMKKISNSTAHLFFADPSKRDVTSNVKGKISRIFMTHPPIEERIKRLREMS